MLLASCRYQWLKKLYACRPLRGNPCWSQRRKTAAGPSTLLQRKPKCQNTHNCQLHHRPQSPEMPLNRSDFPSVYLSIFLCISRLTCVLMFISMNTHIRTYICVYVFAYISIYICTQTHIHIYVLIHIYTHTQRNTYVHICMYNTCVYMYT